MSTILSTATLFFLVMDPLGNIPLFMSALKDIETEKRRRFIVIRELLIALLIMIIFLFLGQGMLNVLHVTQPALTAAGGIVLLLIAIRMIFPTPTSNLEEYVQDEPFIVPLAVPYIAGPSLLAMEVVLINQNRQHLPLILVAVILSWAVSAVLLFFSAILQKYLGRKFLVAIERLMGMILVIISIQMTLEGVKTFFFG